MLGLGRWQVLVAAGYGTGKGGFWDRVCGRWWRRLEHHGAGGFVGWGGLATGWAGHVEGGAWGQDGWRVLAAAGAPQRRVGGGVGVGGNGGWLDKNLERGVLGQGSRRVLAVLGLLSLVTSAPIVSAP